MVETEKTISETATTLFKYQGELLHAPRRQWTWRLSALTCVRDPRAHGFRRPILLRSRNITSVVGLLAYPSKYWYNVKVHEHANPWQLNIPWNGRSRQTHLHKKQSRYSTRNVLRPTTSANDTHKWLLYTMHYADELRNIVNSGLSRNIGNDHRIYSIGASKAKATMQGWGMLDDRHQGGVLDYTVSRQSV